MQLTAGDCGSCTSLEGAIMSDQLRLDDQRSLDGCHCYFHIFVRRRKGPKSRELGEIGEGILVTCEMLSFAHADARHGVRTRSKHVALKGPFLSIRVSGICLYRRRRPIQIIHEDYFKYST
jgi:hypothetical protein